MRRHASSLMSVVDHSGSEWSTTLASFKLLTTQPETHRQGPTRYTAGQHHENILHWARGSGQGRSPEEAATPCRTRLLSQLQLSKVLFGWFWIEAFPPRFSPFLFFTGFLALCLMMCSYLRQRTSGVGRGQASTRASERKNESGVKIRARTARQAAPHPRKSRQVQTLRTRFSILYFIASGRLLDLLFRDFFAVYPPRRKSCTAPTARPVVKLRANSSAHASCTPQFVPPFRTGEGSVP